MYNEFCPLMLNQFKSRDSLNFETFDASLHEFYSKIESQRSEQQQKAKESSAMQKLNKLRNDQGYLLGNPKTFPADQDFVIPFAHWMDIISDELHVDTKIENSPYMGFIYTSFQERATFMSHANTAKLAQHYGEKNLAQVCGNIASDEKCHATAYTKIVEKLAEIDPDTTVIAFADMMKKKIQMQAHAMYDGSDDMLFKHLTAVAQQIGVYSAWDYCDIIDFLVDKWNVANMKGLSDEGRKAQEYFLTWLLRSGELRSRFKARGRKLCCL